MTLLHQPFSSSGFVISLLVAIALALGFESQAGTRLANPKFWLFAPMVIVGMGMWISWIAYWALPGPQPPRVGSENGGLQGHIQSNSSQGSMPPRSKA